MRLGPVTALEPSPVDLARYEQLVSSRRTSLRMDPERAVPPELIERLCRLASWAPNHKKTWPWRFAVFTGAGLSFAVEGAEATIDATSGVVLVTPGALRAAEPVMVTARNSGGSVSIRFLVTVTPAKLDPGLIKVSEITDPAGQQIIADWILGLE